MVEIITIGAGGGSIAKVDAGGLLQVGPESAGSAVREVGWLVRSSVRLGWSWRPGRHPNLGCSFSSKLSVDELER